jgi:hypothetical protein
VSARGARCRQSAAARRPLTECQDAVEWFSWKFQVWPQVTNATHAVGGENLKLTLLITKHGDSLPMGNNLRADDDFIAARKLHDIRLEWRTPHTTSMPNRTRWSSSNGLTVVRLDIHDLRDSIK